MITSRSKFCEHVNIYKRLTTFVLITVTVYTMYERHARQYILIWDSFQPIVPRLPIRYKAVQSFSIWHYSIACVTAAHVSRKWRVFRQALIQWNREDWLSRLDSLDRMKACSDNKMHGANVGPSGSCGPQMGPMSAPWSLLSGCLMNPHCIVCSHVVTRHRSCTSSLMCMYGFKTKCADGNSLWLAIGHNRLCQ